MLVNFVSQTLDDPLNNSPFGGLNTSWRQVWGMGEGVSARGVRQEKTTRTVVNVKFANILLPQTLFLFFRRLNTNNSEVNYSFPVTTHSPKTDDSPIDIWIFNKIRGDRKRSHRRRQIRVTTMGSRRGGGAAGGGEAGVTSDRRRWTSGGAWSTAVTVTFGITFLLLFIQGCDGQLRLGKAVNLFIRYGYLSISMKVISHNDSETWLFKEPTKNIFKVRIKRFFLP